VVVERLQHQRSGSRSERKVQMRRIFAVVAALIPVGTYALADEIIPVPSDPDATYTFIGGERLPHRQVTVTTKRNGASGASYATRLVDCKQGTFKYLAEGNTLEELKQTTSASEMNPLEQGSISYYVSIYACTKLKPPR
jgi:hypothetical protein